MQAAKEVCIEGQKASYGVLASVGNKARVVKFANSRFIERILKVIILHSALLSFLPHLNHLRKSPPKAARKFWGFVTEGGGLVENF